MRTLGLAFTLFITLFITSCQVKEKTASGGLVSDHAPTTNKFTVQTPTAKTYVEAEVITVNVSFPFDMIIDTTGGNPRLRITVGATTRYASYVAGVNPKLLTFSYTVVAAENDTNGIDVNALELNGSTLKFDNNGTLTDCGVATVTTKNFSTVKVDTAGATISAFALTNLPGWYNVGEILLFSMTFSEAVYVTGNPKFSIDFTTGGPVDVEYVSGSGTNVLTFSYAITSSDQDIDGIDTISGTLDIGADTLQDAVGNDASLDFSALTAAVRTYSAAVDIAGQYPFVVDITVPTDGTYVAGQSLTFILEFDRNVNVSGVPYLGITIGSTVRQAQYVSGTGTNILTFSYTAVPGDVDANGITVPTTITQNTGGNIRDVSAPTQSYFGNALNNVLTIPTTTGILVNAIQPQAISVARNTDTTNAIWGTALDNKWIIGQELNVTIGFNTPITVNQTSGTPSIGLVIGSTTVQAPYLSGNGQSSLIFRYVIQEADLDTDNTIALGTITLNGGVLTDAAGTNVLLTLPAGITTTQVDGVRPTISTVTPPANNTYSTVTGVNHLNMTFTINWSEGVNYSATGAGAAYLPLNVGGSAQQLNYASGNSTAAIVHRLSALTGLNDSDGVALSSPFAGTATVRDQAGNSANVFTYTLPNTAGILVDTTVPTVSSVVAITSDGTYNVGDTLDFTVTFSEQVTANVAGGYPRIPITIGATTYYLVPTANGTALSHTFRYTIVASDLDTNGVVLGNAVTSNGTTAYVRDAGQNIVTGTFAIPNTAGIMVDAVAPTVSSVSGIANGTYETTDVLQISITYSEAITVDTTGGTPRIQIALSNGTVNLDYASGSGTSTLVFNYTLTSSDYDFDGLPAAITTISLNGGTMKDVGDNDAPTTFTSQNLSAVFVVFQDTDLWVTNTFTSLAPAGSPSVSNSGAVTTEMCGIGLCRTFTGDDALNLGGALNDVRTLFIVFKTPASVTIDRDIFDNGVTIAQDTTVFDLDSRNGTINLDGATTSGTSHDVNMTTSTTHILQIDFVSPEDFNAGALIGTSFDGAIGEVMAISGALTAGQKTIILNYLNAKY